MTALLPTLAESVASQINGESFAGDFTFAAESSWADFELTLEEEEVLRVDVVPATARMETSDRGGNAMWVLSADIGLRYKFPQTERLEESGRIDPERINALVELTEAILTYLQTADARRLREFDCATWRDESNIRAIAPGNVLRKQGQFLAIIRVFYDVNP